MSSGAVGCSAVNAIAVRADSYSDYILAYHLRLRDASARPVACRAFRARNRQISNGRLYLPLLCFLCDNFSVFTYARHRAHAGATFLFLFLIRFFTAPSTFPSSGGDLSVEGRRRPVGPGDGLLVVSKSLLAQYTGEVLGADYNIKRL